MQRFFACFAVSKNMPQKIQQVGVVGARSAGSCCLCVWLFIAYGEMMYILFMSYMARDNILINVH